MTLYEFLAMLPILHLCLPFLLKVLPLYFNMALGYLAGKALKIDGDTVAKLMIYLFVPIVIFNGVVNTHLQFALLFVPVIVFFICVGLAFLFYWLAGMIWKDHTKNLVGFSAGTGNTGYFGLPLAILLFDDQGEGVYIMTVLGVTIYENTVGFCMIASGKHPIKESIIKLAKLPILYALVAGLIVNMLQIPLSDVFADFMKHIKGAYTVMGMMIIGLGLARLSRFRLDLSFIGMTFLAKFIAWPLLIALTIGLDTHVFGLFNQDIYRALTLLAFVPLAANMVIWATLMDVHPEKAAMAVLLSACFAIVYIPVMVGCFLLS